MDIEAMTSPKIIPSLDDLTIELQTETKLFNEPDTWVHISILDSTLGKCPLQFWNHWKIKRKFPLLSCLALKMFSLEVTNVTVERSMKILGTIMTERRNRLGLQKVNEENR